ncbi:uncharacterized protein NKAPD1-like [Ylistrum balloti]|uniref:uncharacterized protein NKAPD1-like n=1 Tax=Ylistrum balloti TaxID=509963 RepID=UPI002905B4A3|nr:uncharacterized protein NKAPD1-like [Ylistrum balloti]
MFTSAAKTLLRNHIRHADTHNRIVEESEMWACHSKLSQINNYKAKTDNHRVRDHTKSRYDHERGSNKFKGQSDSHASFLYDQRDDSESPEDRGGAYMDRLGSSNVVSSRDLERARKSQRSNQELKGVDRWDHSGFEKQNPNDRREHKRKRMVKTDNEDRWGHSGYKMLYPGDFDSDSSIDHRKTRKKDRKNKKNKKDKKRKKKKSSGKKDREDRKKSLEREQTEVGQVKSEISSRKTSSDLLLLQRFTREIRPKKPSKPRMKMRTWSSDSSADSTPDSRDKSGIHRKTQGKTNRSSDSSFDSSSDSDSEVNSRYKERRKTKKQRKRKRRHESDETDSDRGETCPSNEKRVCSVRTPSSSDSAEESSGKFMLDRKKVHKVKKRRKRKRRHENDESDSERNYQSNEKQVSSRASGSSTEDNSGKLISDKQTDLKRFCENSDFSDKSDYTTTKKHKKKKKKHR